MVSKKKEEKRKPRFSMPLIAGPRRARIGGIPYRERQTIALQYETDSEKISGVLPDCYEPADKPVVTIGFIYNDGVDFLAGRGYNIATVNVSTVFNGSRDNVEGSFSIVMYEDDTIPIIGGRENLGVPKIFADISRPKIYPDGKIRCEASLWGHLLFGIEVKPDRKQPEEVIRGMNMNPRGPPLLGYKYIPSLEGPPDAAYPIATPSDVTYKEHWTGVEGRVYYGDPSHEDVSFNKAILDAVKSLEIKSILGVSRTYSSTLLRGDLAKKLQ
jgi:acetoacetate decarboxylase